ncbi:pyridoxal 5'-phosphate synthase [Glaciihabitans sp. dw_435]|uniref:pyridoxine/pyridoxamine 5'-phosphate oxidase n=1 Tax=Glaciihabitans sp. dw_435 TaxID=2720081 RepID=UPI001BD66861|nr:pyridoxamine 5'-phosphate oxidase family protein [Glaciihabitans sp. dw_435]
MSGADDPAIPSEPWALLSAWLPANDDPDRPQITLSTVDSRGEADARTVLLSEFDGNGFYFHTDALSRKAAHIDANPAVAITVLWPGFTRQIVIRGRAERAPDAEIARAYASRSPYLQQLAWQNTTEFAALPTEERERRWAEFGLAHAEGFDQPVTWTGFLVRPTRLTFWESNALAASQRREWALDAGRWTMSYLAG